MSRFYHPTLHDEESCDYDQYDSFVIEAQDEDEARKLAYLAGGDHNEVWTDPNKTDCVPLALTGVARVIVGSFNAG